MPVITSLSELSTVDALTEDQLDKILHDLDVKIYNILHADGYLGGTDYDEHGDMGQRVEMSKSLEQLRKMREMYADLKAHPEKRGDIALLISQWDNPDL